jgi:DNA-binding MarR family transcriptional regulator
MHPLVFGLKRAHLSTTNFLRRKLRRAFKLTPARFDVLYLVHRADDFIRQSHIRRVLALASSTMTEMLQTLERLGLLVRSRCSIDRRQRWVQLTKLGRQRTAACVEQWITRKAGLRMMRHVFSWKNHPDRAFRAMDDFEGCLAITERWFTPFVGRNPYPGYHPDD